jgi:hypothetical protein
MAFILSNLCLPDEIKQFVSEARGIILPKERDELIDLALNGTDNDYYEVTYHIEGMEPVTEATIARCKNGLAVNYPEAYMRRRDPDCMLVNNIEHTDKQCYSDKFNKPFEDLRQQTFEWLKQNELILLPFIAGNDKLGYPTLLIAPRNAAFFAASLADLQGMADLKYDGTNFIPRSIIFLAPPFRHTHFNKKQYVIHNIQNGLHEMFSYNLYLGPSAKKGVYGLLLSMGIKEGWTTLHGSTVKVITPYDNEITFLHEGASGSGKSEMLEYAHRQADGRLLLGINTVDGSKKHITLNQSCSLHPVTDDMALCHPEFQNGKGNLVVTDAEKAWFVRVNHIQKYGTDPVLESMTIHSKKPLIFLNMDARPRSTCLLWEHIEDTPGITCPNPRVVIPRDIVQNICNEPVEIEYRSFGIRTPPCTREKPSYGIFGIFHLLPPSLAWLWRLVAPRGFSNPSIIDTEGLSSEGVGSYWPFATGRQVDHANILLEQIIKTPGTRYILIPNQHLGAWEVGFMPQWIAREYLARRGQAQFNYEKIKPARSPLAGYVVKSMQFEGTMIADKFFETNLQPEVGEEGYDRGATMLYDFFIKELKNFLTSDISPLGRQIIECCLDKGTVQDYENIIPAKY